MKNVKEWQANKIASMPQAAAGGAGAGAGGDGNNFNFVEPSEELNPNSSKNNLNDFRKAISKLSVRLGQKANRYIPLLRYVSRNPKMLEMLEDLIINSSSIQASTGKRIFGNQGEKQ